jgi:lipopolysaccharide transport system permease protein
MMRDVGHVISILMTFLLFLTPILYAKPKMGILADLTRLNPVYYLIAGARDLVLAGRLSEPGGFAISVLFSMAAFALSLVIFHVTETRITERL